MKHDTLSLSRVYPIDKIARVIIHMFTFQPLLIQQAEGIYPETKKGTSFV